VPDLSHDTQWEVRKRPVSFGEGRLDQCKRLILSEWQEREKEEKEIKLGLLM
jgi:hypothetical protein